MLDFVVVEIWRSFLSLVVLCWKCVGVFVVFFLWNRLLQDVYRMYCRCLFLELPHIFFALELNGYWNEWKMWLWSGR